MHFGPRLYQQLGAMVPTIAAYGTVGVVLLCHWTEWKVVMRQVPFYGSKYPPEEEPPK